MEYCLAGDDGVSLWTAPLDVDSDGDGMFDALGLDLDGDGRVDDALTDSDGDGLADLAMLDLDDSGEPTSHFTDDGSGTWSVGADGGRLRWFSLDGTEQSGGPTVDFDADGAVDDTLVDADRDGLAELVLCADDVGTTGFLDADGDGRWDVRLTDRDGDGFADDAGRP